MHPALARSFGGLTTAYYVRQFLFGLIFPVVLLLMASRSTGPYPFSPGMLAMFAVNTLLYPYSRFVYESVTSYILGSNLFWGPALMMLFIKVGMMALCWCLAMCIAPIGLLYLYFSNSRLENLPSSESEP